MVHSGWLPVRASEIADECRADSIGPCTLSKRRAMGSRTVNMRFLCHISINSFYSRLPYTTGTVLTGGTVSDSGRPIKGQQNKKRNVKACPQLKAISDRRSAN